MPIIFLIFSKFECIVITTIDVISWENILYFAVHFLTVVVVNQLAGFCYEMHSRQYIHEACDICGDVCIGHEGVPKNNENYFKSYISLNISKI
jgi:hypothetical protein